MKKKNLLTVIVSLALVLVLGVGATLAYISASDGAVTNTFKFGSMTIDLTETKPDAIADETITEGSKDTGWQYDNVTPGQDLNKKPEISVNTSVDAYVFVRISGFDASISLKDKAEITTTLGWTAMSDVDAAGNGTYYKTVDGAANAQTLGAIFTKVTVSGTATAVTPIKIQVAAVQQVGLTAEQALAQATFQS